MSLPASYSTLTMIKKEKEAFEAEGRHCMGICLTADLAEKVRRELHSYYGRDPGEQLMTLFGAEVVSTDAPELKFEE